MLKHTVWMWIVSASLIFTGCVSTENSEKTSFESNLEVDEVYEILEEPTITTFEGTLESLIGPKEEVGFVKTFPYFLYKIYPIAGVGSFYIDNRIDVIKNELRGGKVWEESIVEIIKNHAQPGTTVIDIGAHIGTHTLSMSKCVGDQGRVIAFEPQVKLYSELVMNSILNERKNILAYRCAIGDQFAKIEMSTPVLHNEGGASIGQGGDQVEMIPLDSLNLENVSLIKIDVANFEYQVLEGAEKTIRKHKPYMIIEIMGNIYVPISDRTELVQKTLKKIEGMGYVLQYIEGSWSDWLAIPLRPLPTYSIESNT